MTTIIRIRKIPGIEVSTSKTFCTRRTIFGDPKMAKNFPHTLTPLKISTLKTTLKTIKQVGESLPMTISTRAYIWHIFVKYVVFLCEPFVTTVPRRLPTFLERLRLSSV